MNSVGNFIEMDFYYFVFVVNYIFFLFDLIKLINCCENLESFVNDFIEIKYLVEEVIFFI